MQAQLFRAYLASDRLDSNACTLLAPCRLLPRALSVVAINAYAFLINTPGVSVALRNLVIVPGVGGADGVVMFNGARLSVENCVISNFGNSAIYVSANARVRVVDTILRDNREGVYLNSTGLMNALGGVLESLGNNIVRQNVNPTYGTITTVPLM